MGVLGRVGVSNLQGFVRVQIAPCGGLSEIVSGGLFVCRCHEPIWGAIRLRDRKHWEGSADERAYSVNMAIGQGVVAALVIMAAPASAAGEENLLRFYRGPQRQRRAIAGRVLPRRDPSASVNAGRGSRQGGRTGRECAQVGCWRLWSWCGRPVLCTTAPAVTTRSRLGRITGRSDQTASRILDARLAVHCTYSCVHKE